MRVLVVAVLVELLGAAHGTTRSQRMARLQASGDLGAMAASIGAAAADPGFTVVKAGSSYIVWTCVGLVTVFQQIQSSRLVTIDLPCQAGSVKISGAPVTIPTPNMNCSAPGTPEGMMSAVWLWNQTTTAKITIRAYTKNKNCAKDQRAQIYGSAKGAGVGQSPFLTLGTEDPDAVGKVSVTIQNVGFNGGYRRPAFSIVNAKSASLKGVDVKNGYGFYTGAVEIQDTPTTWSCSKSLPCDVSTNEANARSDPPTDGNGGAVYITSQVSSGKFSAKYVNFWKNAAKFGGAFYIVKYQIKAVTATFSSCVFDNNHAIDQGNVGFTYRMDGDANADPGKGYPQPLKLSTLGSNITGSLGVGKLPLAGVYANLTGDAAMGFTTMPWDPKGKSYTTATPKTNVLGKGVGLTLGTAGESALPCGVVNAFVDYKLVLSP